MPITCPARLIMRAKTADAENFKAIAGRLQDAGSAPTATAVLRHALALAALETENATFAHGPHRD